MNASLHENIIADCLRQIGRPDIPPGAVEAYMRCEYGTLDHLPASRFLKEATEVASVWGRLEDRATLLALARSYGLPTGDETPR